MKYAVMLRNVAKSYHLDSVDVLALRDINLSIRANQFTVISGVSGSGKTTLLNIIGCIDRPDSGQVIVDGCSVQTMSDDKLSEFRLRCLGFIFQNFNLLPVLTAFENVEYPLILANQPAAGRKATVAALLDAVGLADKANHRPGQLSGGQRQRVAIARALAPAPRIILADEPTANLDSKTGSEIIALMRKMQREHEVTFIFSSHDPKVMEEADEVFKIVDGRVEAPSPAVVHVPLLKEGVA